jgi:ketosteroid isomerase-like protein
MREGDIDSVLTLYDSDVVFLDQAGEATKGLEQLKVELVGSVGSREHFI